MFIIPWLVVAIPINSPTDPDGYNSTSSNWTALILIVDIPGPATFETLAAEPKVCWVFCSKTTLSPTWYFVPPVIIPTASIPLFSANFIIESWVL